MTVFGLALDWAGVGSLATGVIAAIALSVALKELRSSRKSSAQEIYKEFLVKSLEHPAFIFPDPKKELASRIWTGR
jgi:hypothetical protein